MDEIKLEASDIFTNNYFNIIKEHDINLSNAFIELNYNVLDIPSLCNAMRIDSSVPFDILLEKKENDIKMLMNSDLNYTSITNVEYMKERSTNLDISKNRCWIFNCTSSFTDEEKLLNYCIAEKILLSIKSVA